MNIIEVKNQNKSPTKHAQIGVLFSKLISLKAVAIGTLNIDRKIFKLKQKQVCLSKRNANR